MMKKSFSLLILVTLLLVTLSGAAQAAVYTDTSGHWAEEAIETWSNLNVIEGYEGLFRPDDGITRGEMAAILDRVILYQEQAENSFYDLDDTAWYAPYILKLNTSGVMLGDGLGAVRPLDGITRQEAMVMIARAFGLADSVTEGYILPYQDGAQVAFWAQSILSYLDSQGYITDSQELLRPLDLITRAEVVTLLNNIVERLYSGLGLYNESVDGNAVITGQRIMLLNTDVYGDLIIAGGLTELVILENCRIDGRILNVSGAELRVYDGNNPNEDEVLFGKHILSVQANVSKNGYRGADFYQDDLGRVNWNNGGAFGIDVSEWQQEIDWQQVADSGVEFVLLRVGYRGSTEGKLSVDSSFDAFVEGARSVGLEVGAYFFSQALTPEEGVEEAQFVLGLLNGLELDYPVFFDWEFTSGSASRTKAANGAMVSQAAVAFCQTIEDNGYEAGVYLYGDTAYQCFDLSLVEEYDTWFAGYYDTPDFYYDFNVWQFTSSGSIPGIQGKVDLNLYLAGY